MSLSDQYDVIVVGGGPAGCMAAYAAARGGVSVLLLEKDKEIGSPVRCAEAVGKDGIETILEETINPGWIAATIRKFQFVAPDGTIIYPQVPMTGYVLHRKIFDFDMGVRATLAGAKILTKAYVSGLIQKNGKTEGIQCCIDGIEYKIKAKIIIAADGVESRVARWAGINTTVPLSDMETCCQMTLTNTNLDADTCIFYFSQEKFPGGYAWAFPKGNGVANVGLGISGNKSRHDSACSRLSLFIQEHFPNSSVLNKTIGGVPCANRLAKLSKDGMMLVGDAGLQANPVSGGGIATGMTAGKIAGKIAAEAIKNNDVSSRFLTQYEKEWDSICGNTQKRYYRLKEGIRKLSDIQLNRTAHALKDIPQEKQTLIKIFQTALVKQPSLFVDIARTLSPFS
jgi:digeranylgeranylglycerophospholipid reductase